MYGMNLCRQGNKSDIDNTEDQIMCNLMIPTIVMAWEIPNHIKIWTRYILSYLFYMFSVIFFIKWPWLFDTEAQGHLQI